MPFVLPYGSLSDKDFFVFLFSNSWPIWNAKCSIAGKTLLDNWLFTKNWKKISSYKKNQRTDWRKLVRKETERPESVCSKQTYILVYSMFSLLKTFPNFMSSTLPSVCLYIQKRIWKTFSGKKDLSKRHKRSTLLEKQILETAESSNLKLFVVGVLQWTKVLCGNG